MEQSLHEKANTVQVLHIVDNMTHLEKKFADFQPAMQGKANIGDVQQLRGALDGLQVQLAGAEQSLQTKANVELVQQLSEAVSGAQSQGMALEQAMQRKLDKADAEKLHGTVSTMQAEISSIEHDLDLIACNASKVPLVQLGQGLRLLNRQLRVRSTQVACSSWRALSGMYIRKLFKLGRHCRRRWPQARSSI